MYPIAAVLCTSVRPIIRALLGYVPVKLKVQHPPPRATHGAFELLEFALVKFPSPGPKRRSNAPP